MAGEGDSESDSEAAVETQVRPTSRFNSSAAAL